MSKCCILPDFVEIKFINLKIICEHTLTSVCLNSRKPQCHRFSLIHTYDVIEYRLSLKLIYCTAFDLSVF